MNTDTRCPCGTGETYGNCCACFHSTFAETGALTAPTPEALMRSRFTAFAVGATDYLLATWHPSTRPASLELDETLRWYRLDIQDARGGVFDSTGTVRFAAFYRSLPAVPDKQKVKGVQSESSRFVREGGAWFYIDGNVE
ncbi:MULTISPECIES: YchJ family protein [unclassified Rothia (in: high G+C Gram-positive bacteria)]|uniref:YchJ family protein n=1 Tax=unclassified Rothia (in: high G+C Gram-positive bacteria) TaxID=2689056 RepID=UPI001956E0C1|nr:MULTISPECIES: YchJ family metal-binding protein [unclassified Rothia (in: high G+C Gram-positive bacteria)]MBM7051692.1 SEC-C domain-containing protein [Rothia sp. ZJ1223]QRZ61672.1 SEC-C domain-containing protein [Rothia sp. ZJ932]